MGESLHKEAQAGPAGNWLGVWAFQRGAVCHRVGGFPAGHKVLKKPQLGSPRKGLCGFVTEELKAGLFHLTWPRWFARTNSDQH